MKRYIILGASSEVCVRFIENNYWDEDDELLLQYNTNCDGLENLKKRVRCKILLYKVNFLDIDSIEEFCEEIRKIDFIPSHILHLAAIPVENHRFLERSWLDAECQINVQVRSLYCLLQKVLPDMRKRKMGKICAVLSSCTIGKPPSYMSNYVMAKYALMGMMKALSVEYAGNNIQFLMVSPSMMKTRFIKNIADVVIQKSASDNPMKRNASPDDVSSILKYLLSDENRFINGVNIPVTGGEVF